jgi:hypothetical protein
MPQARRVPHGAHPLIDGPLDRAKYLWYHLPFIHQQREGAASRKGRAEAKHWC